MPKQYDTVQSESNHPTTPHDHYKYIYFETLDLIINCIKRRFEKFFEWPLHFKSASYGPDTMLLCNSEFIL